MYNTLFGHNNFAQICLVMLELDLNKIERFRDAVFIVIDGEYCIEILTRTGGENRSNYKNTELTGNEYYIRDYDDEYDSTYAHYIFRIPELFLDVYDWQRIFRDQSRKNLNIKEMFEKEIHDMETPGTEAHKHKRAEQIARGFEKLSKSSSEINVFTIDEIMKAGEQEEN